MAPLAAKDPTVMLVKMVHLARLAAKATMASLGHLAVKARLARLAPRAKRAQMARTETRDPRAHLARPARMLNTAHAHHAPAETDDRTTNPIEEPPIFETVKSHITGLIFLVMFSISSRQKC
jgi:hypothetical protein